MGKETIIMVGSVVVLLVFMYWSNDAPSKQIKKGVQVVEIANQVEDGSFVTISNDLWASQSFTTTNSFTIDEIRLMIEKVETPWNIYVELIDVSTDVLIATGETLMANYTATKQVATITLVPESGQSLNLESNRVYRLNMGNWKNSPNVVRLYYGKTDTYVGGNMSIYWIPKPDYDLWFGSVVDFKN